MMADASWVYNIGVRWVHVLCACLLVGGGFFFAFLLPREPAEAQTGPATEPVITGYSRSRRRFKMLVHPMILLLLASGIYNAIGNWVAYKRNIPLTHALFGTHVLLALIVFTLLLIMLARKIARPNERARLRWIVLITFLTVLAASSLKWAREHPKPVTAAAANSR